MELNRNPFRYGAEFGLDDIVGRKDEIARVETVIREGRRLFLNGPRGFGKTSILRTAQAHMSQNGAIVLYVNAETSPDVGKLVGEIVAGVAFQLHDGAEEGVLRAVPPTRKERACMGTRQVGGDTFVSAFIFREPWPRRGGGTSLL